MKVSKAPVVKEQNGNANGHTNGNMKEKINVNTVTNGLEKIKE